MESLAEPSNPSGRVALSSSEEGSPTSPADPPKEPTGPPPEPVTIPKESDDQMEDVVEETVDVGFDAWRLLEKKADSVSEKDSSDQGGQMQLLCLSSRQTRRGKGKWKATVTEAGPGAHHHEDLQW